MAPGEPGARHAPARVDPGLSQRLRWLPRERRRPAGGAVLLQLQGAVPGRGVGSAAHAAAGGGAGPRGARDQHLGQLGAVRRGAGARGDRAVHGVQPEPAERAVHRGTGRSGHAVARVETGNGGGEDGAGSHALVDMESGDDRQGDQCAFQPAA